MDYSEQRKNPRNECFIAVNFAFDDKCYTEYIRNISEGGIFISSTMQIPPGRALLLTYDLTEQGSAKRIGQVVWSDPEGMGVRLPEGGEF